MKMAIMALALLATAGGACAQTATTTTSTTDPQTQGVARPDTTNPTAPIAGANSFTEAQAKARLEEKGYSNVTGLKLNESGVWVGKADKGGTSVDVRLIDWV